MRHEPQSRPAPRSARHRAAAVGLLIAAAALGACRGERSDSPPRQFLPDMDDQTRMEAQTATPFFANDRSARTPVHGTVAFGRVIGVGAVDGTAEEAGDWADDWRDGRASMLKDGSEFYHGLTTDGRFLDKIPASVSVDEELLVRGQDRFNVFCAVCHGYDGGGRGTVGVRWSVPAANLHDAKYTDVAQRTGKDGYIFDVIRHGVWDNVEIDVDNNTVIHYSATGSPEDPGQWRMPPYQSKVSEADAWAIVAYVRLLQAGRTDDLADVPDQADRDRLRDRWERERSAGQGEPSATRSTGGDEDGVGVQADAGRSGTETNG